MAPGEDALDLIYEHDGVILNEREIRQLLGQLDGLTTRRARYLSSLLYALLFAYADRWSVAYSLARRAVEIAQSNQAEVEEASRPIDNVTGREAYYLACVTRRLTSRERGDLSICQQYLESARKALARDVSRDRDSEEAYPPMTGLRFDAEEVAVATARAMFEGFTQKWKLAGNTSFVDQLRRNMERITQILNPHEVCGDERIRRHAFISLRSAYFSSVFLLECAEALLPDDIAGLPAMVAAQLADWRATGGIGERAEVSTIDMQTVLYATSLIPAANPPRPPAQIELPISHPSLPGTRFLMTYDQSRRDFMVALAAGCRSPS
jgi:hypothetical protein